MKKEQSFLQTIKMEISRSFKLIPYERLAFHKILGIYKSDTALEILLKELDKGPDIRESALTTLVKFKRPEVLSAIIPLLREDISNGERFKILKHIEENGNEDSVRDIIDFINTHKENLETHATICCAFNTLKHISNNSEEVLDYLISIVSSDEFDEDLKVYSISVLSEYRTVSTYENILKKEQDELCYAVYRSIYDLNIKVTDAALENVGTESTLFTYSQEDEDKILLDIRVLLGKMSSKFDSYSDKTKVSFICAMISCNHREFLIYTMKALTSGNRKLINMTLYGLYININRVRDPDKLLRSLIALSTETDIENELAINIFVKFFTKERESRQFHVLKEKLYSYIVVTLETYFESYRKDFMITDVIEKSYPESFQMIRKFILERLNPEFKKKLVNYLIHDEATHVKDIVNEIGNFIKHVKNDEKETLASLIDVLYDTDKKSRENSASRIEGLNFEKRYLRNRIIRLCRIISTLNINDGSSILVNIYNYLKKYDDPEIKSATIHTLSTLNYSYMLGEIEVQLTTGTEDEQEKALKLISLFTEQRSLNILMDYISNNFENDTELVELAVNILTERDINGNATANQFLKKIIEKTENPDILRLSILGLGNGGLEADIDYMNKLFYRLNDNEAKDHIVRSIGLIISTNTEFNKRNVIKYLTEYLKDPGIKVRVYSCLFLVKLGNKDAIRSIRDMLVIKNKTIQREILTILGDLKSIEFSFFLVSLLKEEYGITNDIISLLQMLPEEDLKEIDAFIVNIFRKYEAPDFGDIEPDAPVEIVKVDNLKLNRQVVLNVDVSQLSENNSEMDVNELIEMHLSVKSLIISDIIQHKGTISMLTKNRIVALFLEPDSALKTSMAISANLNSFRIARIINKNISIGLQVLASEIKTLNDELIDIPKFDINEENYSILNNRIVIDEKIFNEMNMKYAAERVSELLFIDRSQKYEHYEVYYPVNFDEIANQIIDDKIKENEQKDELDKQLEEELKKLRLKSQSPASVAIAGDLENIGMKLNKQLNDLEKYVQKRSTDRELIQNVRKMLNNINNSYKVEVSRLIIK